MKEKRGGRACEVKGVVNGFADAARRRLGAWTIAGQTF